MTVSGYGLMIALGLLCSGGVGWLLTRRFGLNFYDFLILVVYVVAFGVAGAKVVYLLLNVTRINWAALGQPDYLMALLQGGFVFYGGVPFGLAGLFLAGRVHHIAVMPYLRVCLPLLPLAHGFGRIGCHLAGCCYGVAYDGPLAVVYQHAAGAPLMVPLFPVQLAEAVAELALFAVLLGLVLATRGEKLFLPVYLIAYGLIRFSLEFLRGDGERGMWGPLSTSQWISVAVLAGSILYLIFRRVAGLRSEAPGGAAPMPPEECSGSQSQSP